MPGPRASYLEMSPVLFTSMSHMSDTRETRARAAEVKFLVDPALAAAIRVWARARLAPDPHGTGEFGDQYRTTSLYFDTAEYDIFYRRGSSGRSKYRARRYGGGDIMFLERKLTRPGLVAKRRTAVALADLHRLNGVPPRRDWEGDWFHRRLLLRGLRPVCQVSYLRMARVGTTSRGPQRLTLDERVAARPSRDLTFSAEGGERVVDGRLVLELKYPIEMPSIFRQLVAAFSLVPQPASKYRLGLVALGFAAPPART